MTFSISDALFTLVLFLFFLMSAFLLGKGQRLRGLALLGCFFLALALNLLDSFLLLKGAYNRYTYAGLWGSNLLLVCGPLLFFYTKSVIDKGFAVKPHNLWHFLPFCIFFITSESSYLLAGTAKQQQIIAGVSARHLPSFFYLLSLLMYGHFVAYLLAALRYLQQYRRVPQATAPALPPAVKLVSVTLLFFMGMVPVLLLATYLSFMGKSAYYYTTMLLSVLGLLVFTSWLLLTVLHEPAIFGYTEPGTATAPTSNAVKQVTPGMQATLNDLLEYMNSHKPYLEPSLTLESLARQVQVKPKTLSLTINSLRGQTFFEFINEHRIEEAKRMLTNPADKKITILEVMYQVGFNSKSSFNTLFKKNTGLTPGDFKKANTH